MNETNKEKEEQNQIIIKSIVSHILKTHLKKLYSGPVTVQVVETKLLPTNEFLCVIVFLSNMTKKINVMELKKLCEEEDSLDYIIQPAIELENIITFSVFIKI